MITAVGACFACLAVATSVEVGQAASPPRDRIPPSKPTIDGDRATGNLRPVFHFGARDNRTRPSQITFRCAIDSALFHPCARIYQPFSNLAFGSHVLRVRAKDRARNASRVATITFVVVGTWDAATDFPLARPENPAHDKYGNTTWFYLYGGVPVHDPMQYRALPEFHQLGPTNYQWNLGLRADGNVNTPLVGVGAPGILIFHPDRDYFAVVGWRSPIAGKISVELQLRFPDPALQALSNGIAWSLDREAMSLQAAVLTPGNEARTSVTLDVSVGDTLYVVIGNNGDSDHDTTIGSFRIRTLLQ